jgi:hypothetical protein
MYGDMAEPGDQRGSRPGAGAGFVPRPSPRQAHAVSPLAGKPRGSRCRRRRSAGRPNPLSSLAEIDRHCPEHHSYRSVANVAYEDLTLATVARIRRLGQASTRETPGQSRLAQGRTRRLQRELVHYLLNRQLPEIGFATRLFGGSKRLPMMGVHTGGEYRDFLCTKPVGDAIARGRLAPSDLMQHPGRRKRCAPQTKRCRSKAAAEEATSAATDQGCRRISLGLMPKRSLIPRLRSPVLR